MFKFWLFVHIMSTVLAFGPTYTLPAIAALARKGPRYGAFAAEVAELIEMRYAWPFVLLAGISGVALIVVADIPWLDIPWLWISIVVYVLAMAFSLFVQTPNTKQMVQLTARLAETGEPPADAPAGPPPELAALGKKLQLGGIGLSVASLAVFYLMIVQPDL